MLSCSCRELLFYYLQAALVYPAQPILFLFFSIFCSSSAPSQWLIGTRGPFALIQSSRIARRVSPMSAKGASAFSSPILPGGTSPVLAGNAPPCPVLPMPRVLVPSAPGALRSLHLAFPSPSLRAHNKRGPGETACPHEREGLMGAKGKRVKRLTMLPVLN